jgi:hypothetical protein
MRTEIPIEGSPHLVKDTRSHAVLSTDIEGLRARKKERERVRMLEADHIKLHQLESRLAKLEAWAISQGWNE